MIDLLQSEHDALRRLTRTGDAGLPLSDVGLSAAIRLELLGLASLQSTQPQVVHVTQAGAAFSRRTAFA